MINAQPGLDAKAVCSAISSANELVLHAALYSNFALPPFQQAFIAALNQSDFKNLTVITVDETAPWLPEFNQILRQGWSDEQIQQAWQQSAKWCEFVQTLNPDCVEIHCTAQLPLNPILLIGEQIFVGHYAHSLIPAAKGLWLSGHCHDAKINIATLWQWAKQQPNPEATDWQIALFRYVAECYQAMTH